MPNLLNFPLFSIILILHALQSDFVNAEPVKWISPEVLRQIRSINDEIIKPPTDKREYRHILLKNDMQILLISAKDSIMAGASLIVNVGSNSDPREYQGLSNLLLRMITAGSEKYPKEKALETFVSAYNGYTDYYTDLDEAGRYFAVLNNQLTKALDIFVDQFVSPLLSKNFIERQLESVDSESSYRAKIDIYRQHGVMKWLSHKNHDFNKYRIGNRYTLNPRDALANKSMSLHQALVKFYKRYYSSNLMGLVVIGNFTLDHLTEQVVPLFGRILNKNVKRPTWPNLPYDSSNLGYQVNIRSIKDMRLIKIWFPVAGDAYEYRKNLAFQYVEKLFEQKGPDSLLEELKIKQLATYLNLAYEEQYKGFFICSLYISATDKGFSRVDDVIRIVFNYINKMKEHQPEEWLFTELAKMWRVNFKLKDKMSVDSALAISWTLRDRKPHECMYSFPKYRSDLIAKLLQQMDVANFNVFLISTNFTNMTFEEIGWVKIEYSKQKIVPERMQRFQQQLSDVKANLPKPNMFIPSNLSLVSADDGDSQEIGETTSVNRFPQILHQNAISRVWYKQDLSFQLPKTKVFLYFYSPVTRSQPVMVTLLHMYLYIAVKKVDDQLYDAREAGVKIKLYRAFHGLECKFEGYSEKMDLVIEKFMTILLTAQMTNDEFQEAKQRLTRRFKNSNKSELFSISSYQFYSLMFSYNWPSSYLLKEVSGTTFEDLLDFKQKYFTKLFVEFFAYGNVNKAITMKIYNNVMDKLTTYFPVKPFMSSELHYKQVVRLPKGSNYLYKRQTDAHNVSSAMVFYQIGLVDDQTDAKAHLLRELMGDKCRQELQNKEQLGFYTYCTVWSFHDVKQFMFFVQGHYDPSYVDSRIEALLITLEEYLHNLNDSTIEAVKSSMTASYLKPRETLFDVAEKLWSEIRYRRHYFDWNKIFAENVKNITKAEILKFFKTHLSMKSASRKKLAIHVKSTLNDKPMKPPMNLANPAKNLKVKIIRRWDQLVNRLQFYPLPKSHMNLPTVGLDPVKSISLI